MYKKGDIVIEDHPRRCGENYVSTLLGCRLSGSPPQVRGKLNRNEPAAGLTGITPAGAGKTYSRISAWRESWDHPRRCGENRRGGECVCGFGGSPPQVRGKLNFSCSLLGVTRITPAGAGKTAPTERARRNAWDHPRRCGENLGQFRFDTSILGSPPQVRGKLLAAIAVPVLGRITPAGAGKTAHADGFANSVWDHPRRCGENHGAVHEQHPCEGSPPQVRGKRAFEVCEPQIGGITPAGAGKTIGKHCEARKTQDHPRRCGENTKKIL